MFGQAGILDTARFRTFIAWETGASGEDVHALVLGGHGDQMVPVVSATTVGGVPLTSSSPQERHRRDGRAHAQGRRRGRRAARHVRLVRARRGGDRDGRGRLLDQKRVLPCTAYLEGEYGISDLYMGVPVKLGASGIEEIVELDLTEQERTWLDESAAAVRDVVGVLS